MKFRRISGWGGTYVVPIIEEEVIEDESVTRIKEVTEHLRQKLKEKKRIDAYMEHVDVILHELKHCRASHPDDSWPWKSFDFVHQVAVMMEEAGEAVRAANNMKEGKGGLLDFYRELAQTAAMCLRCMEQIRAYDVQSKG